jgi:hypothetical protein
MLEAIWRSWEKKLSCEAFGGLIPLFVNWGSILIFYARRPWRYSKLMRSVMALLRPDFIYVTLSQGDEGITGLGHNLCDLPRNLLIISACGQGHIPMLLHVGVKSGELRPENYPITDQYEFDAVFAGNFRSHPLRRLMGSVVWNESKRIGLRFAFPGKVKNWTAWYLKSKFILSPRGWGRGSYRLTEVLQMGMIPVYIFSDIPWLPYYDSINWSSFSIVSHLDDLSEWCKFIRECPEERVNCMRKKIQSLWETHFSFEGMWNQLKNFLQYGFSGSDVRCAPFLAEGGHLKKPVEGQVDLLSVYRRYR